MSDEYFVDQFYTHATDKKGHCVSVRTAMPPELVTALETLVASRVLPAYRTTQDIVRDSVFHRLNWLQTNIAAIDVSEALATWQAQIALAREADWHRTGKSILEDINYIRMNARAEADKIRFKEIANSALGASLPETVKQELLRIIDI